MAVRARWRATSDASDAEDDDLGFDIVEEDSSLQFEWLEVENQELSDYETALANPSQLNLGPDGITHVRTLCIASAFSNVYNINSCTGNTRQLAGSAHAARSLEH
jgi:hypothetical protein